MEKNNSTLLKARILIVDDQAANIDVLRDFLEFQGYENVAATQDSREVERFFRSFKPDLMLLDLLMPFRSGFDVLDQLKKLIPSNTFFPVLVLTADITAEAKQKALSGGASDFISKPFDLVEVGLRIKNLLFTRFLHQQLQDQNFLLEAKVKERTSELERKNTELQIATELAEASDRLKTAFINNISHEIRTPLNSILGFAQFLAGEELKTEEKRKYLSMMKISSNRLINLITNFIDISLISSGNQMVFKENIRVDDLLDELSQKYRDFCTSKNIQFKIEREHINHEVIIQTDLEMIKKVLDHLIDNAVKFTRTGTVSIGYKLHADQIQIFVKDTGIGIPAEKQDKIFESFQQGDMSATRGYEGSGLGLSIARGFVNLMGGKIWLYSVQGIGSTFRFSLPFESRPMPDQTPIHPPVTVTESKQTVLVAEDDDFNLFYLRKLLEYPNIEILEAKNGLEAVEACRNHPEIKLILMDLKMPEMDGIEATAAILKMRKKLPIIAVTAYSGNEDKQKAILSGCVDYVTKPIEKNILIRKLVNHGIKFPY